MKEFEFSHESVAKLEEQIDQNRADADDDGTGDDPVEQSLEVPTERPEDDAVKFVQKQYEEKSGLELDEDSARDIVKTARAGSEPESGEPKSGETDTAESETTESGSTGDAADEKSSDSDE